ncbi:MAG: methyltransferase domain-containing protein [Thermodesulfobacteriota bacterium]
MIRTDKNEINYHGLRVFKPRHPSVRRLKRLHTPAVFGNRVWETSWLLIDFIKQQGLRDDLNILEVGCGWGLPGIYCAKNHKATVTGLDCDAAVFPYLRLHAEANQVEIATVNAGLEQLTAGRMSGIDVLIGAEICFWDKMVSQLGNLIHCALTAGVRLILLADPGRTPFDALEAYCLDRYKQRALTWRILHPYLFQGRILKFGSAY